MKKENEEFTLKEFFSLFLPKLWVIVICGVLFASVAGVYSLFIQEDKYTTSATIYVYRDVENNSASGGYYHYYDSMMSQKMVKTYSIVLKSRTFLEKVIASLPEEDKTNLTPGMIAGALEIKQVDETEVFDIYFTSSDKKLSCDVMEQITTLAEDELKQMLPSSASDVKVIDSLKNPEKLEADSKNFVRNTLISFIVGVVVSMVAVYFIHQFDVTIRNKKKLEDNFDIPVLGVIPKHNVSTKRSGA